MLIGRLVLALLALLLPSVGSAQPPSPVSLHLESVVLEVVVRPGPSQDELATLALTHDLVDRLVPPAGRSLAWVDPKSEARAPRLALVLSDATTVTVTLTTLDRTAPLTLTLPRPYPDVAAAATTLARRLGWRTRAELPLSDPELAGLLMVLPERALQQAPSPRAVELFLRSREASDEPLRWELVAGLAELSEGAEVSPCEDDSVIAALTRADLAALDKALEPEEPGVPDVPDSPDSPDIPDIPDIPEGLAELASVRGPGGASVLHLAATWPDPHASALATKRLVDLLRTSGSFESTLEARDRSGATPLLSALQAGNHLSAELLLQLGARVTARTHDGVNVIHAALRGGLGRLVPGLARRVPRAVLTQRDGRGLTPLGLAARLNQLGPLRALRLTPEADAVLGACARGDLTNARTFVSVDPSLANEAVLDALELGRPIAPSLSWLNEPEDAAAVPLAFHCALSLTRPSATMFAAALEHGRAELATALIVAGLPLLSTHNGQSLVHLAARYRDASLIRLLTTLGADADTFDWTLSTPLELAVDGGDLATVDALLEVSLSSQRLVERALGSSVDSRLLEKLVPTTELDPLARARVAVALDDERALRTVLSQHPEVVGDTSGIGLSLLHLAARFGRKSLVPVLLSAGESPELEVAPTTRWHGRDLSGWTALHVSAFHGHLATYHALLALGLRPTVAADGTSPEDHLRFQMGDLGSLGTGSWASRAEVKLPIDVAAGDVPEMGLPTKPTNIEAPIGIAHHDRPRPATARPSFIALGGGVLFDEEAGDELEVWRADIAGGHDTSGPADGWEDELKLCLREARRVATRPAATTAERFAHLAERDHLLAIARGLARRLRHERSRFVLGDGPSVQATAALALAKIELEARAFHAAEAHLDEVDQFGPGKPTITPLQGAVASALGVARGLARRGRGALSDALVSFEGVSLVPREQAARLLHWRGLLLGELGRYADAVAMLRSANLMRPTHMVTRLNLATLLGRAGARTEARTLAAMLARSQVPGPEREGARLLDGMLRLGEGDMGARAQVESALESFVNSAVGHPAIGRTQLALARLLRDAGHIEEARAELLKAQTSLELSDGAESPILGAVASEESELLRLKGRLDEALAKGREAYALVVSSEEAELVWPVERQLARLYRELSRRHKDTGRGGLAMAVALQKRAVDTLKWLRSQAAPISQEVARAFTEDRIDAWRDLARDLADLGRFVEALAVLEALRVDEGRSLTTRGEGTESNVPVLGPERLILTKKSPELRILSDAAGTRELTPQEKVRLDTLRSKERERRKAFEAWLVSLELSLDKFPPQRAQAIAALNLRDVSALQGTLARLGPTVAVLHYVFADDHVRVVVTTARGQVGRDGTLGGGDVLSLVMTLREQLIDPSSDPRPVARELWSQLIEPIAADLEGIDTLFFALDGPLRYLPMAALWDGERWLVERFKVAHLSKAALDKLERHSTPTDTVGALGTSKVALAGYAALPAVAEELEAVVKTNDQDPGGVMPGEIRLNEAFTREALVAMLEGKLHAAYHIASHFVLAAREPDSFLLLGDGERLTLEEIRYDLRFDGVDLLALSACNTAVGQDRDGRELEGFASLALRLGARQVLATLWPVGDTSTGALMKSLYLWSKDTGQARSQALRLAMLGQIRGAEVSDEAAPGLAKEPTWPRTTSLEGHSHPFYWAPFVLIGSWL